VEAAPAVVEAAPAVVKSVPAVVRAAPAAAKVVPAVALPVRAAPAAIKYATTLADVTANIETVPAATEALQGGANGLAWAKFLPRPGILGRLGVPASSKVAIQVLDNPGGTSTLAGVTAMSFSTPATF
jgi:hypothetical protein